MMRLLTTLAVSAALLLGAPLLAASPAVAASEAACDGPGQPPCPPKPKKGDRPAPAPRVDEGQQQVPRTTRKQHQFETQKQRETEAQEQRRLESQKRREVEVRKQNELELQKQREVEARKQRDLEARKRREMEARKQYELELRKRREFEAQQQRKPEKPKEPLPPRRAGTEGSRPPAFAQQPPVLRHDGFRDRDRRWSRGDHLPREFRQDRYAVRDWRSYNLPRPPSGYLWYCDWNRNCFLAAIATGYIRETRWRDDLRANWRHRYTRLYAYRDDYYYLNCRRSPDPAGILLGGLIGGLLGSTLSDHDNAGAIFAGVILGTTVGAILTNDMGCDDRSHAYRAYYDGLNGGVLGRYPWANPWNRHRGEFVVLRYYHDPYGFYCADYRQTAWLPYRRVVDGYACRQPDGAWVFLR